MGEKTFSDEFEIFLKQKLDWMRSEYHRVLPVGDLFFNRFDKARYVNAGEGSSIYDASVIMGDVEIGEHVWIGPFTMLEGMNAPIRIGDHSGIGTGVSIFSHSSVENILSGGKCPVKSGEVIIGSCTFIGSQSLIDHGVHIGDHCLIAANSFVTEDVPDYSIAAGTPAKVIGRVKIDEISGEVELVYDQRRVDYC